LKRRPVSLAARLLLVAAAVAAGAWQATPRPDETPPGATPRRFVAAGEPAFTASPWEQEALGDLAEAGTTAGEATPLPHAALVRNAEAVALAGAGDHAGAVALLRELFAEFPGHPLLQQNLRAALLALASAARHAGDLAFAEELVLEAADVGSSLEVWSLLGAIRRESGDSAGAAVAWEQALGLDPSRADVALGLATALAELDQRDRALDALFRVRDAGHANAAVETLIERLSREVDAEWDFVRVETDHFHLDFDATVAAETVDFIAGALDEAYGDVAARLGVFLDEPARAVLYPDANFHTLTQTPDWTKGVFDGRIKIPLGGLEVGDAGLPAVLRHEYAHHVIAALSRGRCPVWMNEGLAMWAEELADERLYWAEERIVGAAITPFAQLQASFSRLSEARAEIAYAQSYLAVRQLADDSGIAAAVDLLRRLGDGAPFPEAFRAVYRMDLETFERGFRAALERDYGIASGR
jgi:tetratricopeptide (TPR) repeat protein